MAEYIPRPIEIQSRCEAYQWMKLMEWPERLIDAIFMEDNPDLETVRVLIYAKGPDEAQRLLMRFL